MNEVAITNKASAVFTGCIKRHDKDHKSGVW